MSDFGKPNKSDKGSVRYNEGKLQMHLVPPSAITSLARVLSYGAIKYDENNWRKGNKLSVPYSSMMRHLMAFWEGEDNDIESKLCHLDHVLMNAAMMVEYFEKHKELDDRPDKTLKKESDNA